MKNAKKVIWFVTLVLPAFAVIIAGSIIDAAVDRSHVLYPLEDGGYRFQSFAYWMDFLLPLVILLVTVLLILLVRNRVAKICGIALAVICYAVIAVNVILSSLYTIPVSTTSDLENYLRCDKGSIVSTAEKFFPTRAEIDGENVAYYYYFTSDGAVTKCNIDLRIRCGEAYDEKKQQLLQQYAIYLREKGGQTTIVFDELYEGNRRYFSGICFDDKQQIVTYRCDLEPNS